MRIPLLGASLTAMLLVIVTVDAAGVINAQDAQPLLTFLPVVPVDR